MTEQDITSHLMTNGWSASDVDRALALSRGMPNVPVPPLQTSQTEPESDKSYALAWLFSLLLGPLGVDRFYRGFVVSGIVKLVTLGGLGVWSLIDWVMIGLGSPRDKQGRLLRGFAEQRKTIRIITWLLLGLWLLCTTVSILLIVFLTVPSLQHNEGDTQRKNDVSLIASGISEYRTENNGELPSSIVPKGTGQETIMICGASCTASDPTVLLGFYRPAAVTIHAYGPVAPDTSTVYVIENATCNALNGPNAKAGSVAIIYSIEYKQSQECLAV